MVRARPTSSSCSTLSAGASRPSTSRLIHRSAWKGCSAKSVGAPLFLARRLSALFLALQQVLERLQVGSHLAPDHPLEHRPDEPEVAPEGLGECDRGACQRCADAYGPDRGPARYLIERVGLAAHRDDRGPHSGFEPLVEPRQVEELAEPVR